MSFQVRSIDESQVAEWVAAVGRGFLQQRSAATDDIEARRPGMDLGRTLAGFDGDRIVSTLRSFSTELTVPGGGQVLVDAVTAVTTTASHRRQGLASAMVTADLQAAVDRGEPAAVLIAAEWGIYGRFGYGPATEHQDLALDTTGTSLRRLPQGTVEFVDRDTARELVPTIYQLHKQQQPGELAWQPDDWDLHFGVVSLSDKPDPPSFHVIARDGDGEPVGYARYTHEEKWVRRQAAGRVDLATFFGVDVNAQELLWKHLIDLDLATSVLVTNRSPGDLLPWLLVDPRQALASERADFVWLRVLEPTALLGARHYPVGGSLVIELVDPIGPAGGRFALDVDGSGVGSECRRTTANPDLTMPVASLASVYLGGHRVRTLADVGLIDEHTAGAVERADLMFGSSVVPWSSMWF